MSLMPRILARSYPVALQRTMRTACVGRKPLPSVLCHTRPTIRHTPHRTTHLHTRASLSKTANRSSEGGDRSIDSPEPSVDDARPPLTEVSPQATEWMAKEVYNPLSLSRHALRGVFQTGRDYWFTHGFFRAIGAMLKCVFTLLKELFFDQLKLIPTAIRLLRCYYLFGGNQKNVRYGFAEHQTLDLYSPTFRYPDAQHSGAASPDTPLPLVLYVHGGAWGTGDKWQYSSLAQRISNDRKVHVAVMRYGLYPQQGCEGMLADVDAALTWALAYGDSPAASQAAGGKRIDSSKVTLMGQSAGAHLALLVLLRRAISASRSGGSERGGEAGGGPERWAQPAKFVGVSGVYDIAPHYLHERGRCMHAVSPMWIAMGGPDLWHHYSPTRVATSYSEHRASADEATEPLGRWLPAMELMHSRDDSTVPCSSTAAVVAALRAEEVQVGHREWEDAGHGELILDIINHAHKDAVYDVICSAVSTDTLAVGYRNGRPLTSEEKALAVYFDPYYNPTLDPYAAISYIPKEYLEYLYQMDDDRQEEFLEKVVGLSQVDSLITRVALEVKLSELSDGSFRKTSASILRRRISDIEKLSQRDVDAMYIAFPLLIKEYVSRKKEEKRLELLEENKEEK